MGVGSSRKKATKKVCPGGGNRPIGLTARRFATKGGAKRLGIVLEWGQKGRRSFDGRREKVPKQGPTGEKGGPQEDAGRERVFEWGVWSVLLNRERGGSFRYGTGKSTRNCERPRNEPIKSEGRQAGAIKAAAVKVRNERKIAYGAIKKGKSTLETTPGQEKVRGHSVLATRSDSLFAGEEKNWHTHGEADAAGLRLRINEEGGNESDGIT